MSTIEGQLKSHAHTAGAMVGGEKFFVHLVGANGGGKGKEKKEAEVYELAVDESSTETATAIRITDMEGNARVVKVKDIDWELGEPIFRAHMDGATRTLQCLATETLGYRLLFGGAYVGVKVYTVVSEVEE